MKKQISTSSAPAAIGPYSQGVACEGKFAFVSGQLAIVPETGAMVEGGIQEQTEQSILNVKAILNEAGFELGDVVKTTVYLSDILDFSAMNEIYAKYFEGECPARAAFQVAALPKNGLVEIEAIACK